jgi:hypothetical protein
MNNTFKGLTSILLLVGTAQFVQADSGFKQSTLSSADTSGKTWNAINVTHGCDGVAYPTKDVIALSVLFPVAANAADFKTNVLASKGLAKELTTSTATIAAIDPVYDTSVDFDFGTTPTPTITAVTTGNIFPNTIPVAISGKVVGFQSWLGKPYAGGSPILETAKDDRGTIIETIGSGAFELSKIVFRPTSCVQTLKIYAASVNWCESGKKSFSSPTRLDAWVESATTIFGAKSDITEAAHPPKLTIKRDLTKTPLPVTGCENATYDTVILQPSNAFIDKYLPIKSAKWPVGTGGQLFWPTVK